MNQEYYIGQVFEGIYPPDAAVWCVDNNAYIDEIEERVYEIKEIPEPPAPTKEEVKQMRKAYRQAHIDDNTLERDRKKANGTWTEEDEEAYLALDAEVTAYIEEHFPYPTDPIYEEQEEENSNTDAQTEPEEEEEDAE